ncbi:hypothetical protein P8605_26930 [Streptomyces sp. T-3]|nr:hypothetical protein [Streptomyces sp. T-3]
MGSTLKDFSGTLLPDREATGTFAFDLPAGTAQEIEVQFQPDRSRYEAAVWSGPTT